VYLPWNPAVLEQRIGRVHRLGQRGPVQVVNLVAQGTIEESMLSLLGFKQILRKYGCAFGHAASLVRVTV
jgi:SNF2 family DNA or RNA helicase